MENFGEWVREQRLAKHLTEAECARRADMKRQNWHRLETTVKRPERETVEAVARALGVDLTDALAAAGYSISPDQIEIDARLGRRLAGILRGLDPEELSKVEEMLASDAGKYVKLVRWLRAREREGET